MGGRSTVPAPPPVVRMPTPQDPNILAASRRRQGSALNREGRRSTILSDMLRGINGSAGMLGR